MKHAFSRGRRLGAALVVVALALVAASCYRVSTPIGVPLPRTSRFDAEWKRYARLHPQKAIAVAGDMSTVYVTGYAFGHDSEPAAVDAALSACEARRADRRIIAPCHMYAIGDRLVGTASSGTTKVR